MVWKELGNTIFETFWRSAQSLVHKFLVRFRCHSRNRSGFLWRQHTLGFSSVYTPPQPQLFQSICTLCKTEVDYIEFVRKKRHWILNFGFANTTKNLSKNKFTNKKQLFGVWRKYLSYNFHLWENAYHRVFIQFVWNCMKRNFPFMRIVW